MVSPSQRTNQSRVSSNLHSYAVALPLQCYMEVLRCHCSISLEGLRCHCSESAAVLCHYSVTWKCCGAVPLQCYMEVEMFPTQITVVCIYANFTHSLSNNLYLSKNNPNQNVISNGYKVWRHGKTKSINRLRS